MAGGEGICGLLRKKVKDFFKPQVCMVYIIIMLQSVHTEKFQ